MSHCFVAQLTKQMVFPLQQGLQDRGFSLETVLSSPSTLFQAKKKGVTVTVYTSLKMTVQGRDMKEYLEFFIEPEILQAPLYTHKNTLMLIAHDKEPKIGSDEAGKGDYFGPLVVASVFVRGEEDIKWLLNIGVKDSKHISDVAIRSLAALIQEKFDFEILALLPHKYNELYEKFGNLNSLLAWAHATTILSLAKRVQAQRVLVDKFANETVLHRAITRKKPIDMVLTIEQRVRAEDDMAVAAASILARSRFLQEIDILSKKMNISIPKGAGSQVSICGRQIVAKYTADILHHAAKMHFVTTQEIIAENIAVDSYHI